MQKTRNDEIEIFFKWKRPSGEIVERIYFYMHT